MEEEELEHCYVLLMVEGVGQCEMEEVGQDDDAHVKVVVEVEHSYWEEVGLHD